MIENKRGQGLSTNAIILIILGVIVLVVLVIGFTMGWDKIAPWISTDNVDTIKTQCEVACSTNSVYDYCTKTRDLKAGEVEEIDKTCKDLSELSYGIGACSSIICPTAEAETPESPEGQ